MKINHIIGFPQANFETRVSELTTRSECSAPRWTPKCTKSKFTSSKRSNASICSKPNPAKFNNSKSPVPELFSSKLKAELSSPECTSSGYTAPKLYISEYATARFTTTKSKLTATKPRLTTTNFCLTKCPAASRNT